MIGDARTIEVDGLETGYYEAGTGPTVVLLHSGEHGGCAELTWEYNFAALAQHFHVLAPDWLGCGNTAKIHDFTLGVQRRLLHMQRFLAIKDVAEADFIAASMGGALALRALSIDASFFPARSLTVIGAGGAAPDNPARRDLVDYDCTIDGMRKIVAALFHRPEWTDNEAYIQRRFDLSIAPGTWECAAAARFKSPLAPARSDFGQPDTTDYESLAMPVLVIGGAADKLKEPGYGEAMGRRLPDAEVHIFPECGHFANIEYPDQVNNLLIQFLKRVNGLA